MPEREFELYLSLLSRFLRLKPAQRDGIADELRDHLDQRLQELANQGLSHEEAIRTALDEFGDAAELAKHFTRASHIRRRRLMMRCTYGTIAAMAAGLLFVTAFWPESPHAPLPARGIGQDSPVPAGANRAIRGGESSDASRAQVEAKLAIPVEKLALEDVPLQDVLNLLSDQTGVDILIDKTTLQDDGIAVDTPVTLSLRYTSLPAHAVLKLVLEPLHLGYLLRDGLVMVTTRAKLGERLEIEVYNVRDLQSLLAPRALAAINASPLESGQTGPGGVAPAPGSATSGSSKSAGGSGVAPPRQGTTLADVITETVEPESWGAVGGAGSVVEYNGLLIARQTREVHAEIRQLLEMMRKSAKN
ncbi:MAG: permease prefix domain 1-containing protein [Planctomycetales bacterium]